MIVRCKEGGTLVKLYAFVAQDHHFCIFSTAEKALEYLENDCAYKKLKNVHIYGFYADIPMFEQNIDTIYKS